MQSGVVNRCDESPDYVALHPGYELSDSCYKVIELLDASKEQDICPQINTDEHR